MKVLFRADASTTIGSGHIMRCLTLADVLRNRGAAITFACKVQAGDLCALVERRGYPVHRIETVPELQPSAPSNAAPIEMQLHDIRAVQGLVSDVCDWIVVDHYALGVVWERSAREFGARICVIDDLANRHHDCDVLVDQNHSRDASLRYTGLLNADTLSLVGAKYAMVRPEFFRERSKRGEHPGTVKKVLVCFGGSDPQNYTNTAVRALAQWGGEMDVVMGRGYPYVTELQSLCHGMPNVRLHHSVEDMATLLAGADLAIGGGGGMNWERACLGVPTLAFSVAPNQEAVLAALLEEGLLLGDAVTRLPSVETIQAWMSSVLDNKALLKGLSERSAALIDGRGAERIADALILRPLRFRPAAMADSEAIYAWRTAPEVLAASYGGPQFSLADHQQWMQKVLNDPVRQLLIAENDEGAIGVVRLDTNGDTALISVYRATGATGRDKLVLQATRWIRENCPDIRIIRAEIMPDNVASVRAFTDAGYRCNKHVYEVELR